MRILIETETRFSHKIKFSHCIRAKSFSLVQCFTIHKEPRRVELDWVMYFQIRDPRHTMLVRETLRWKILASNLKD